MRLFRFLLVAGLSFSSSIRAEGLVTGFEPSARQFTISGPGVTEIKGGFAAIIGIDGKSILLSSREGQPVGNPEKSKENTPYGETEVTSSSVNFPKEGVTLGLKIGMIPKEGIVLLQPFLKNVGDRRITLISLKNVDMSAPEQHLSLTGSNDQWIVTPLDQTVGFGKLNPVLSLETASAKGTRIHDVGTLYRGDGLGFLYGPVGEPEAYLSAGFKITADGILKFNLESQMSGILVDPGETRTGQESALWFRPPREALPKWADWVAATHHARNEKGALDGWSSWYHLTNRITGKDILGVVDEVKKQPDILRPQVIQIDDGYQDIDGVWDANVKFPEGLPFYARKIAETGARPGLWMAMTLIGVKAPWLQDPRNMESVWGGKFRMESKFRPDQSGYIDPTNPRAKEHIADRIRHAVESGFTYLKLDFNNIGAGGWWEKKRTSFQIMRDHYTNIRQAAGESTYILFCSEHPDRAVVGLVDSTRTSHDAAWGDLRSTMDDVLRSYQLNGRWGAIDNDTYYLAANVQSVCPVKGGDDLLRTWISMMGLSSGAAFTSAPWHWPEMQPYLRIAEIMQPPARERAEVLDLGTATVWPRIASLVHRPWGNQGVVLLWNPSLGKESKRIDFQLAEIGLNGNQPHAVWSFWDDKFLGVTKGSWTTPPLPPGACQHLVFTPVDEAGNKPVLIGSNLHIHCGAAEIAKVDAGEGRITVELTDAGAREGDLFFWSAKPLEVESSSGLELGSVKNAGENVWKVTVKGRQSGKPQTLQLKAKTSMNDDISVSRPRSGGGFPSRFA
jgi:hypothetical protein